MPGAGPGRGHAAPRRGPAGGDRRRSAEPRPPPGEHLRQHPAGGPAVQHAAPSRSLQLPEDHRRPRHRVEDLAGRAHLHLQDPPGRQVPRRLPADRRPTSRPPTTRSSSRRRASAACGRTPTPRSPRSRLPTSTTVVFKLKFPSASLLSNLASPWNVIFPKKYLDQDPNYFKTHAIGSGPFKFKSYTRGATFEGERNSELLGQGPPLPGRVQVLHQPGDLGAGGGRPLGARLRGVPGPAQRGSGRDQQAARRQGHGPGDRR